MAQTPTTQITNLPSPKRQVSHRWDWHFADGPVVANTFGVKFRTAKVTRFVVTVTEYGDGAESTVETRLYGRPVQKNGELRREDWIFNPRFEDQLVDEIGELRRLTDSVTS